MDELYTTQDYSFESDYAYTSSMDSAGAEVVAGAMLLVVLVIGIITYVIHALLLSMVFKKAGVAPWKAWVPVLNSWKMLEIGGQPGFWAILSFVPLVNFVALVFTFIAIHNINLKLRYGAGMTVLAIFLTTIWLAIVAFTKNPWTDGAGAPRRDQPDFSPTQDQAQYGPQPQYAQQPQYGPQQPYAPQPEQGQQPSYGPQQYGQQPPQGPQQPPTPPQPPMTPGQ